ncbi:MAG: hypothetical protein ACR2NU_09845, partial [Aeoliella sp.]
MWHLETSLAALQDGTAQGSVGLSDSSLFREETLSGPSPIRLVGLEGTNGNVNYALDFGGYVKADFIYDFNAIGSTDTFDPLTIPTDGRRGTNTRFHARQTRLNLDFRPHANCDETRLFIEGDFFGDRDSFRLRHAFVRVGRLKAGHTWSTFMDESILPRTLDFESARSVILDRRGLIRWTEPITDSLKVAMALEDPQPRFDVDSAPAGNLERAAPDLIGRMRYERPWGHLQGAGLVRLLRFRRATGAEDDEAGFGFNFTGRLRPHQHHS